VIRGLKTPHNEAMPALARVEPGSASRKESFPDGTQKHGALRDEVRLLRSRGSKYGADPTSTFAAFFGETPAQGAPHPADLWAAYQLAPTATQAASTPSLAQSFRSHGLDVAMADATDGSSREGRR